MERFDELLNKKRDAVRALDRTPVRLTERWEAGAWSSEIFEFQR
jgi:hypothetical protein